MPLGNILPRPGFRKSQPQSPAPQGRVEGSQLFPVKALGQPCLLQSLPGGGGKIKSSCMIINLIFLSIIGIGKQRFLPYNIYRI